MSSKAARGYLSQLVFGTSDGLLAALAITLAVGSKGRGAVLLALFAVFIAGACGMAVGQFLSAEHPEVGWKQALVMGGSTGGATLAVGIPWLFASGAPAEFGSGIIALLLGAGIAQARPGGWDSWAQTLGLLAAVAAVTGVVGHA